MYFTIPELGANGFNFSFSSNVYWYYIIVLLCCLTIFVVQRLDNSGLGRSWAAMREDEVAAASMGVNIMQAKLWAFSLGAVWGGIAGLTFANFQQFVSPESFTFMESVFVVCAVVIGGMGSIPGAIVGALLIQGTPEIIRGFAASGIIPLSGEQVSAISNYRNLVFGLVMVMMMAWRPQGILPPSVARPNCDPTPTKWETKRARRSTTPSTTAASTSLQRTLGAREVAQMAHLVDAQNVTMQFGGLKAVNDVTMHIDEAEIVALIGPNGAGKTTFFNMLTGIYTPTQGTLTFKEKSVGGLKPHVITRLGITRTFQNIRLFQNMTALENVMVGRHTRTKPARSAPCFARRSSRPRKPRRWTTPSTG